MGPGLPCAARTHSGEAMYIDYLTLMLINLVAGLVIMAAWVFFDAGTPTSTISR